METSKILTSVSLGESSGKSGTIMSNAHALSHAKSVS